MLAKWKALDTQNNSLATDLLVEEDMDYQWDYWMDKTGTEIGHLLA